MTIRPTARLADNADGAAVKALLMATAKDFNPEIPFDDIYPYWIVAELPDRGIVGCIQTCPSRPIARLEMLAVANDLNWEQRICTVRALYAAGITCCHLQRAYMISAFVPYELKAYKRFLKKHGSVVADSGNLMLWRIAMEAVTREAAE